MSDVLSLLMIPPPKNPNAANTSDRNLTRMLQCENWLQRHPMKTPINHTSLEQIDSEFENLWKEQEVMKDGAICMDRYSNANLRVMWILKQNIHFDLFDYSELLLKNLHGISSSPTWRRIAHASHGLLSGIRDFSTVKSLERKDCRESMISTAIVNVNKELGGSRSSDSSVHEGYRKYKDLVGRQIEAHAPDVIIICMVGAGENLKPIVESIYKDFTGECEYRICGNSKSKSADVAWSKSGNKVFLWTYHPSYTRITDIDFFTSLINAYDEAVKSN